MVELFCAVVVLAALLTVAVQYFSPKRIASAASQSAAVASQAQSDPWPASQTVEPSDLVKELGESKGSSKPIVVCAGFRPLYASAHVPGAVFHGAAQSESGLADLKKWAQGVPRSANVVVYCGCCPFARCPNIRPAFTALREMGFTKLRVLLLPRDFATDWVEKGHPVEKGAEKYSTANR